MFSDLPWWLINTVVALTLLASGAALAVWGVIARQRARQRMLELEASRGLLQNLVRSIPDLVGAARERPGPSVGSRQAQSRWPFSWPLP